MGDKPENKNRRLKRLRAEASAEELRTRKAFHAAMVRLNEHRNKCKSENCPVHDALKAEAESAATSMERAAKIQIALE